MGSIKTGRLLVIAFFLCAAGFSITAYAQDDRKADASRLTIVAFGNSITSERNTVKQVFAQRLPGLLAEKGIQATVINSGIPGSHTGRQSDNNLFKIRHALDRFETDVLAHNPDLVIIGFGTNDAAIDGGDENGPSRIPLENYKRNLEYMITQLQGRGAKVLLRAPVMLGAKYGKIKNERLLKYIKTVYKLARKYNTGLADNYRLFIDYQRETGNSVDALMLDGIHPNDLGHQLIADQLVDEIVKMYKSK